MGDEGRDGRAQRPPEGGSHECGDADLGSRQEKELPPARAEPGESLPGGVGIAAHAGRREQREGEEERGRLTADEEQPASRDPAAGTGRAELLGRRDDVEKQRLRAKSRAGLRHRGDETAHLPRMNALRVERNDPGVGAVEGAEPGQPGERAEALGHDERRLLLGAKRLADPRSPYSGELPEQNRRDERSLAHLDEAKARARRDRPLPAELEHLAALRCALHGKASRGEPHPALQAVDGREVDERAVDAQELVLEHLHGCRRRHGSQRSANERLRGA